MKRTLAIGSALSLVLLACGARQPPPPSEPAASTPAQQPGYPAYPSAPYAGGYPPPPPGTAQPSASASQYAESPQQSATRELDISQRELDVAGGDCTNACRALSSMDRAAGRICSLVSGSDDDTRRCSEAKERVYSARTKVKNTCGTCTDTSVERSDPIPYKR